MRVYLTICCDCGSSPFLRYSLWSSSLVIRILVPSVSWVVKICNTVSFFSSWCWQNLQIVSRSRQHLLGFLYSDFTSLACLLILTGIISFFIGIRQIISNLASCGPPFLYGQSGLLVFFPSLDVSWTGLQEVLSHLTYPNVSFWLLLDMSYVFAHWRISLLHSLNRIPKHHFDGDYLYSFVIWETILQNSLK